MNDKINRTADINHPLKKSFFARPAELVAPDLIGCRLIKKTSNSNNICGVIVETEAYSQAEPA
ncbi:MAG: DNA-3-methyladenine glycosylase, partial [Prochlorococcaceae cyanobacterium ETNP1_MAG_9]|nr:DNA-3-methyladenine glycosylase [Prochlorococcaceae cyanobacterium ETNP1_MAG_9]